MPETKEIIPEEIICSHCNYKWETRSRMNSVLCPHCKRCTYNPHYIEDVEKL